MEAYTINNKGFLTQLNNIIAKYPKNVSEKLLELNGISSDRLALDSQWETYISDDSESVDPNANKRDNAVPSTFSEFGKGAFRLFGMEFFYNAIKKHYSEEDAKKWLEYQFNMQIYTHDLHGPHLPYCYSFTLDKIVEHGLTFIQNVKSVPPKHVTSFIQHVIQFIWYASNSIMGAVAIPDFFYWLAYILKQDSHVKKIDFEDRDFLNFLEQQYQILLYSINQPTRQATQSPYTNMTFYDKYYLEGIFGGENYPNGDKPDLDLIDKLQKHFLQFFVKELEKQVFTFPVVTIMLYKDKDTNEIQDKDFLRFTAKLNLVHGNFNFFIDTQITSLSTCCRLRLDFGELNKTLSLHTKEEKKEREKINSFGSGSLNIGSTRVITINLPRIAKMSNSIEEFYAKLAEIQEVVNKALMAHKKELASLAKSDKYPLYKQGFIRLDRQYTTVGITGVYEAVLFLNEKVGNLMKKDIVSDEYVYTDKGIQFIKGMLDNIKKINKKYEEANAPYLYNIEQTPSETAAVKLAEADTVLGYQDEVYMYSNQWYPLISNVNVIERIKASGILDNEVDGGAILHLNIGEDLKDVERMEALIKLMAEKNVIYGAVNFVIVECVNGHVYKGSKSEETCKFCGAPIKEKYTRIVGYVVPVSAWNKVRKGKEFKDRKFHNF